VAAARLGAAAAFVGCVSTDEHGVAIWDHLTTNGVDTRACRRSDAPTARAIVEHTPKLVFRFEGEGTADTLLEEVDLSVLGPDPKILHGGTLGLFRGRTAETLARLAETHNGIVSLDSNIRPQIIDDRARWEHFHERWLGHTDIYKGSDEDFAWVWPEREPEVTARALVAAGVTAVVLTRGADGLSIFTSEGETAVSAPAVQVVDTVGAGDTIVGTILASLDEFGVTTSAVLGEVRSEQWAEIGRRAVVAAGITCSRAGADPPYRHETDW
jgi:fructokinase